MPSCSLKYRNVRKEQSMDLYLVFFRMVQARGNVRETDINENAENFPVTLDVGSNLAEVSQNTLDSAIQSLCDDFIFECILGKLQIIIVCIISA